jgi:hypothetical protein
MASLITETRTLPLLEKQFFFEKKEPKNFYRLWAALLCVASTAALRP